jgi:hypothetical protein
MGGDVEMHDPPSIVSQHKKHVQDLKTDSRYGEEVDRHRFLKIHVFQDLTITLPEPIVIPAVDCRRKTA